MASLFPTIGQWYQDSDASLLFEVVAIDEKSRTIEIQYQDGDIGEIELEAWGLSSILPAATPEDGNGAYGFSAEEHWQEESFGISHSNPLELIEPDLFQGFDDI